MVHFRVSPRTVKSQVDENPGFLACSGATGRLMAFVDLVAWKVLTITEFEQCHACRMHISGDLVLRRHLVGPI